MPESELLPLNQTKSCVHDGDKIEKLPWNNKTFIVSVVCMGRELQEKIQILGRERVTMREWPEYS